MAREIYEIKLKDCFIPALSEEDALEIKNINNSCGCLTADDVRVGVLVNEEHTMKLFLLAKSMSDTEKFECNEIEAAVGALALQLGYYNNYDEVAECVVTWVERFADMTMSDLEEWIIG